MNSINFDNPWLLLIAIPLLLLIAIPFFITIRKDNRNVHNVLSSVLHVFIAVLIAFSAAGTYVKSLIKETNVYVVADLSYSSQDKVEEIDGYISHLYKNLPDHTEMGVVCFGATNSQVVHTPLGDKPKSVRSAVDQVDNSATDIVDALQRTSDIFKNGVVKRIVLITDAKQTSAADSNALKRKVDELYTNGVYVDAIYLDSNLSADAKEVQLSSVEAADKVYIGKSATATVTAQSTQNVKGALKVTCNGEEYTTLSNLELDQGYSSHSFKLKTDEEGTFTYTVSLEVYKTAGVANDENLMNNLCSFTQTVTQKANILFITDTEVNFGDDDKLALMTGITVDEAKAAANAWNNPVDSAEKPAIEYEEIFHGEEYTVSVKDWKDSDMPCTVTELCQYDEIVLSNFKFEEMTNAQAFAVNAETVVANLGKSLLGVGDLGFEETAKGWVKDFAKIFPVEYVDPADDETKNIAIVLDVSASMGLSGKFALAKSAAKRLIDLLDTSDTATLIVFADSPTRYTGTAEELKSTIEGLELVNGTTKLREGMDELRKLLSGVNGRPDVYLITDGGTAGQTPSKDFYEKIDIVNNPDGVMGIWQSASYILSEYGATTTVLAISPENSSIAKYLQQTAETYGGGKYYKVENANQLTDDIFISPGTGGDNSRSSVSKEVIYDDVLTGLESVSFPYIEGFTRSKIESTSTTVLTTKYKLSNAAAISVPLYAYRTQVKGRVASFTATFSGTSLDRWAQESLDVQFFNNVFVANTPVERLDIPFSTKIVRDPGSAEIQIAPAQLKAGASVDVTVISPEGERTEMQGITFSASRYVCTVALPTVGSYAVEIVYRYNGQSYATKTAIHVSYLSEYDSFTLFEPSPLYKMLSDKGTVFEIQTEDDWKSLKITNDENEIGVRIVYLTIPLLIVAVVLFVADIVVRKIKWADIKGLFKKIKKEGRS